MESLSEMGKQVRINVQKMFSNEDLRLNNLDDVFTSFCRNPLHIAVMSCDTEFANKILSKKPDLALKQDSNGFTPLHLASVRTSLPMVRLLLKAKPGACIVQDQDGRTPLHLAATMNRVEIIKLLMEEGLPEAIHLKNDKETILHLCVKSNTNLKTLKLLVGYLGPAQPLDTNSISIDSMDNDGNTILHLAVEMGNMKITNYLLLSNNVRTNLNVVNKKGLKALNMLPQDERNDLKLGFYGYHVRHNKHKSNILSKSGDQEGLKEWVNAIMVVATLIAGIAFQAAMNPPGGVWQDDTYVNSSIDPVTFAYYVDHMFGSFISGGLDRYIQENLQYSAITNSSYRYNNTMRREEDGAYPINEYLVKDLVNLYAKDKYYHHMTLKGLILEDFLFTDVVSSYNNATNSSTDRFFPYLIRHAGYPIMAYIYPTNYAIYIVTNGVALLVSLTTILLVICGFMIERSVTQVRILVVMMCISIGSIAFGYLTVLAAMVPHFYVGAVNVYFEFLVFFGVCCIVGVGLFIWSSARKIVKLRKRTRHHCIGIISYFKALFSGMDAMAAGKLVLFIVCYGAFRLAGYVCYDDWSHINSFLF